MARKHATQPIQHSQMHRFLTNVFAISQLTRIRFVSVLNKPGQLHTCINSRRSHNKIIIVSQYPEKLQIYFQPFSWNLFSLSMLLQFYTYYPIHNTLLIKFIMCHMELEENILIYQLLFTNLVQSSSKPLSLHTFVSIQQTIIG